MELDPRCLACAARWPQGEPPATRGEADALIDEIKGARQRRAREWDNDGPPSQGQLDLLQKLSYEVGGGWGGRAGGWVGRPGRWVGGRAGKRASGWAGLCLISGVLSNDLTIWLSNNLGLRSGPDCAAWPPLPL